jgi:nucleoside-triphosphatase
MPATTEVNPMSARAWLLTGRPGVGKTTCLGRALARLGVPAAGFVTEEVREGGERVGFALVTLDGRRGTLAHVGRRGGGPRVGKYRVDLETLEGLGVPAIGEALQRQALVVIDEIGKMEMASPAFRHAVEEALTGEAQVLGTILQARHPWADHIKRHPAVHLFPVTTDNRNELPERVATLVPGAVRSPRRRGSI